MTVEHHSVGHLSFIGEQRIPNDALFNETSVGSLSGIDYNPQIRLSCFYILTQPSEGKSADNGISETVSIELVKIPYKFFGDRFEKNAS
ncbi:hypothetical protein PU629_10090 [Pullulanibacillus sp. KACC 23026]|uniref:hypothetical protein n=1 Tax=Pullulanibacillus sp. KACC 23026 TaxID=3028315 RepID=UPI0023B1E21D|nr:hypothetical protein [Pullulanibacillus sp. KACC 23026]WEG14664.1 hypothetical protein PU629_10090 [Pullulanibacillus sp. KACC 23026]